MTSSLCCCVFAFSVELRQPQTAFVGENVHIRCAENKPSNDKVDWLYQPSPTAKAYHIVSAGFLPNGNRGNRIAISGSTLFIYKIKNDDSGRYSCIEDAGQGPTHSVFLTVKGTLSESIFHAAHLKK